MLRKGDRGAGRVALYSPETAKLLACFFPADWPFLLSGQGLAVLPLSWVCPLQVPGKQVPCAVEAGKPAAGGRLSLTGILTVE